MGLRPADIFTHVQGLLGLPRASGLTAVPTGRKPEPGRAGTPSACGLGASLAATLTVTDGSIHPACSCFPGILRPACFLRGGAGPEGLHVGAWERGQVAPTHPAWFEQPQKEETPELLSSVPPSGSRAAWSRGRAPAARERPRASLQPAPAAPTRPVAPQGLPPAPAADPPLPAARISCPFPNSLLVSPPPDVCSRGGGEPSAWDAAFHCPRPSWPSGGPRKPEC